MIKYKFKVEVPFLDKTNNLKEVKKDSILEVTEERLEQLNAAEVGRVISAEYVEDKAPKATKGKNKKDEKVEENPEEKTDENPEGNPEEKTDENPEGNPEEKIDENSKEN